jgi:hypothetical protein
LSFNYKSPEAAFNATQKALSMLSENVNVGIESVEYINEYDYSKDLIFKIILINRNNEKINSSISNYVVANVLFWTSSI